MSTVFLSSKILAVIACSCIDIKVNDRIQLHELQFVPNMSNRRPRTWSPTSSSSAAWEDSKVGYVQIHKETKRSLYYMRKEVSVHTVFISSKILVVIACSCIDIKVNDRIQLHERIQRLAMFKHIKKWNSHCIQLRKEMCPSPERYWLSLQAAV